MNGEYRTVLRFFILVFVLSVPFWLLGNVYPVQLLPGLPIGALAVFVPTLAAVVMAYGSGRFPAVRRLLGRSFDLNRVRKRLALRSPMSVA
jgi:hypothetical protein